MGVNGVESGGCEEPRWRYRLGRVAQRKYLLFNCVVSRLYKVPNIYERGMEGGGAINGDCEDGKQFFKVKIELNLKPNLKRRIYIYIFNCL